VPGGKGGGPPAPLRRPGCAFLNWPAGMQAPHTIHKQPGGSTDVVAALSAAPARVCACAHASPPMRQPSPLPAPPPRPRPAPGQGALCPRACMRYGVLSGARSASRRLAKPGLCLGRPAADRAAPRSNSRAPGQPGSSRRTTSGTRPWLDGNMPCAACASRPCPLLACPSQLLFLARVRTALLVVGCGSNNNAFRAPARLQPRGWTSSGASRCMQPARTNAGCPAGGANRRNAGITGGHA
jgi:hypothetical protein